MKSIRILLVIIGASVLLHAQKVEPPFNGTGGGGGGVSSVAIRGTANQITASGTCTITTSGTCTLSLPAAITLPGTVNKYTFTAPATGATIALADGSTLATSGAFSITLTSTGATNVTLPTSGTLLPNSRNVNTTSPLGGGGDLSADRTLTCATCVVASSPGAGIAHFAGSTQTVTSSAVSLTADVSGILPSTNGGSGADLHLAAAHSTIISNGANPAVYSAKTIPDCHTAGSSALTFTQSTDAFGCNTISGGGGALTVTVDSTALGAYSTLTLTTGTGVSLSGVDTGSTNNVTVSVNTSTVNILASNQNVTGIKTHSANTLVLVPGADSGTTDGALNINASKQFDWYDATNSVRRIAYAFTGTPATASQILGGSATAGLTSVYSTSGTGTTICLTGACTLSNPVIGAGGFVNANHTHADAGNGGALTGALFDSWTLWTSISTPSNPASGKIKVYALTGCATGLATLTSAGVETCLGAGGSSIDTLTGTGSGATATVQIKNLTATTGVSDLRIINGAGNEATNNYGIEYYRSDNSTLIFGASKLGVFVNNWLNFCDAFVTFPCPRILANSEGALDLVSDHFTGNSGHGIFNFEVGADVTITSGSASLAWFDNNSHFGFAPTSGTAVWNGVWMPFTINQTGGASGITRGAYINPTLTAAADFRGLEISDVGSNTAILTGTGSVKLGTLKTTGSAGSKKVVCVDTSTGQLYASSTGTDCSN